MPFICQYYHRLASLEMSERDLAYNRIFLFFVAEHFETAASPGTTSPNIPISLCQCGAHRTVPTKENCAAPPKRDPFLSLT